MKKCNVCNLVKPLDCFYNNVHKKEVKRSSWACKPCHSKYMMDRWKKMKTKAIEYLGGECFHCKQKFHRSIYQFHHLREKDAMWDTMKKWSWKRIYPELDKCVVLCANCHVYHHSDKD